VRKQKGMFDLILVRSNSATNPFNIVVYSSTVFSFPIRRFIREFLPLLFCSVKSLFSSILLLPGLSPGTSYLCSRLLTPDLDFMHPFLAVKEKVAHVPYCVIFKYTSLPEVT
jgi:hypothetical protein